MKPGSTSITLKFLCASLLLMLACGAVTAQSGRASASVTKSNSPSGNVCTDPAKQFTFNAGAHLFKFCLSDEGNIGSFQSPQGFFHISNYEGYVACGTGAANAYSVGGSQVAESGWGPVFTSQPGGPNTLPLTLTRQSTDGKFEFTQVFEWDPAEKELLITMSLQNISGASITNARLSRYFYSFISSDAGDDIFDRDSDSVWGNDPGAVAGHHTVMLTALTFTQTHTAFAEKFNDWQPNGAGAQTSKTCVAAAQPVPTAPGDYVGRITYVLGTLSAGASKSVQVVYRRL